MFRTLLWIYSILYTFLLIFYLPLFIYRVLVQGKDASILFKRIGAPPLRISGDPAQPSLWIHAVSVGEVKAIEPLVEALALNRDQLFISTITDTGQSLANSRFQDRACVFYFPFDWKWICRLYLRRMSPTCVLLAETEIWPGFISAAESLGIPVLLINGRISDHSFRHYRRIRFFLRPLLHRISLFCVQTRQDRDRIVELGAASSRVHPLGNLKYDYQLAQLPEKTQMLQVIQGLLKPDPNDLLWICGSTREGEDNTLLKVFQSLSKEFPSLRLLLAPRHPHRVDEIARLVEAAQLSYVRRSELNSRSPDPPKVLLLDTIGELAYLYQLADVVFVGGSLVPTGGHNIIEVAYFSKPILFGPHMENFKEISNTFLESDAALQVHSGEELSEKLSKLLKDPPTREALGSKARQVIGDNQGAVGRSLEMVERYLRAERADTDH
jgi:3-deoxy-D-manno-octulosonic-acid transferase